MAQANAQTSNPVTTFFKNLRPGVNTQQSQNGPTNQQQNRQTSNNQQQNQNIDPAQFKFDPMTGKPVGGGSTNNPETQQSPLDAYKGLWDKIEPGQEDQPPQFSIKPEQINSAAEGLDFVSSLPEDLNLDGLGENRDTILALLNHVGRMAYATSINHQSQLTGKFTEMRLAHEGKNMPKRIRDSMTDFAISSDPAASKSPIVKESMKMISTQLKNLHPDASPDWIAKTARQFFLDLTKEMHPDQFETKQAREEEQAKAPGGTDFDWEGYGRADDRRAAAA